MRECLYIPSFFFYFNMSNIIDQAIDILYKKIMEMPNKVLDIFNNFYGEERVDMQGFVTESLLNQQSLSLHDLFSTAGMLDNLKGTWDLNEKLTNIDTDCLPEDNARELADAISSDNVAQRFKRIIPPGFILVHFPRVTVTNEYNRSTVVKHLYIKVPVDINGTESGVFTMNRSEYTIVEMFCNYMHSHAKSIPIDNFENFSECCLGSGPLNNTQASLSIAFDEDRWNIFCLELSKYVEVESVAGTPYHRLENLSLTKRPKVLIDRLSNSSDSYFFTDSQNIRKVIQEFLSYYLDNNDLIFSFRNGVYSLGISCVEYLISISNAFIEWLNNNPKYQELEESQFYGVIDRYFVIHGEVYGSLNYPSGARDEYKQYIGSYICTFKGHPVTVAISDINMVEHLKNSVRLLRPSLASFVLNRILRTINYRYGRNQEDPSTFAGKIEYKV